MSDDYLWDKSGEPDPEVVALEKALSGLRHTSEWQDSGLAETSSQAQPPSHEEASSHESASSRDQASSHQQASSHDPTTRPSNVRRLPRAAWIASGALALAASVALAIGTLQGPGSPQKGPLAGLPTAHSASTTLPAGSTTSLALASPCPSSAPGFPFESRGPVTCAGGAASSGNLPVGTWLETGEGADVTLRVADIGAIALRAGSRLRLVNTGPGEHRLELVKGSLHAKVDAPPRLFVIDTRAATAVDLGCEYDLSIDDEGRSHLRVIKGAVSLEGKGRAAVVPREASVIAAPDTGPGTVLSDFAGKSLLAAASRLDRGDVSAFEDVLAAAERSDSVTLWNLLSGSTRAARTAVVKRLDALRLRPARITGAALIDGKPEALAALRVYLEDAWYPADPTRPPSVGSQSPPPKSATPQSPPAPRSTQDSPPLESPAPVWSAPPSPSQSPAPESPAPVWSAPPSPSQSLAPQSPAPVWSVPASPSQSPATAPEPKKNNRR